jgi:hypothetical protein
MTCGTFPQCNTKGTDFSITGGLANRTLYEVWGFNKSELILVKPNGQYEMLATTIALMPLILQHSNMSELFQF